MNTKPLAACALAAILVAAGGCDNSPSSGTSGAAPNNGGNPINNLAQNPSSLPGRSAARGRDVARQVEANQDQAVGLANEISGQAQVATVSGLEFRPPTEWKKTTPKNAMQTAAFEVAPDEGSGETLCVFFSGIKGDVQSHVQRWRDQVIGSGGAAADATVTTQTAAGLKVTLVSSEGTYKEMTGMAGSSAERENYGFRGAIIEAPGGLLFVRLTGPKDKVDAASGAWRTTVLGFRK